MRPGSAVEDARSRSSCSRPCSSPWRWSAPSATTGAPLDAQEQVAGQRLQAQRVDHQHRFCRLRPDGAASITQVLTWFHSLLFQWEWELFLTDPFIFPVLDLHHRHRLRFGAAVCSAAGCARSARCRESCSQDRRQVGSSASSCPLPMHERPPEVAEVRDLLRPAHGVDVLDGAGREAGRGRTFKTTFLVGMWNRAAGPTRCSSATLLRPVDVRGAAVLRTSARSAPAGDALDLPLVRPCAARNATGPCKGLRWVGCGSLAIHPTERQHRPSRMPAVPDCMVMYDDHACPPLARNARRRTRPALLTPIAANGYIPISRWRRAPAGLIKTLAFEE